MSIAVARLDATDWNSNQKLATRDRENRARAMRAANEAAAYNRQLADEIQAAIDDLGPSITHDAVMAEMDADIAALPAVT